MKKGRLYIKRGRSYIKSQEKIYSKKYLTFQKPYGIIQPESGEFTYKKQITIKLGNFKSRKV